MESKKKLIGVCSMLLSGILTLCQYFMMNVGSKLTSKSKVIAILLVGIVSIALLIISGVLLKANDKKVANIISSIIRIILFFAAFLAVIISVSVIMSN
ncbi:MAG: hypothetical protein IJ141_02005 [Lachnospiraceae bacterium]|nr:hypothetical protein [Lachnospiraceae bacterium]